MKLMNCIKNLKNGYNKSPSLVYFLLENKAFTLGVVAVFAFILRFGLSIKNNDWVESLGNGLEFASILSASFIAMLLYFKEAINKQLINQISKIEHTAVFGLGEFSTALLESEVKEENNAYIIFEKNLLNEKIEHFRKSGMGVVEGDAFSTEHLEQLNFKTISFAIISLGNDRLNIELATIIIEYYKSKKITTPIKLLVHVINQDLNTLFHQNFISQESSEGKIDIQTFSFYEEAAETFFEHNFVDGDNDEIISSNDGYSIVVAGDGELALNIIYQAAKVAHLPNENTLNIHLVDKEAQKFKNRVIKRYSGIEKVLNLHTHNMNDEDFSYFNKDDGSVWFEKNLTHVIIAYDDQEKNIKIATDLFNKTYLENATDKTLKTKVSFAIFNAYTISGKIDADKDSFAQFFSFADIGNICTRENLLDEKHSLISKLVHHNYAQKYAPVSLLDLDDKEVKKIMYEKWYNNSKLSDKLSSIAQAKHMKMKLKALRLQSIPSKKSQDKLIEINREVFDTKLSLDRESLGLSDSFLQDYSDALPKLWEEGLEPIDIKYFPKKYTTMLEKLIRAEHNRWNAYHYLNGWTFKEKTMKTKKEHACLKPLSEFDVPELQLTVIYDIYSILYIPNYLANAGYEIIEKI
ncbi:MAG: NAD-binding protein [Campylobacterota bacterium]|nr:NAD-binding protein [Campylobacterota bacterium]